MAKKRDEGKIAKGREQLEEAKRTYEVLNSELHDELPALYDSRILFLVTNLQTLFNAEQIFHSETSKVIDFTNKKYHAGFIDEIMKMINANPVWLFF